jgi:hypothetical protein
MDINGDGEASGPFLRAYVLVDLDKLRWHSVMLKYEKTSKLD